jgi:Zn-dependent protease with chaperone function
MENIYPIGPANVPPNLTKPRDTYKQRAILATIGLLMFVILYLMLTGWFIVAAYRFLAGADIASRNIFVGLLASFLAIFMLKPLFRVQRISQTNSLEISPQEEPKLFEFLYRLADEAQAPRPHRVFLSPSVNACVFYDMSVANLILPSKKNLEIGLGLVNVLTLGEMKAVLAHEFGHFAQRSMAVGTWVYVAQKIASQIVAERDILDKFLKVLSNLDVRIAWVGWLLSLIVWSIRSLLETGLGWVILAQRALSREMEFQADLVAVSLTGSDALIHALHRLQAADDAWDRTLRFAGAERQNGRLVPDLFALQTFIIERMRTIFNDADYGRTRPIPIDRPEEHRVFQTQLAEPPRMWATHPSNTDRENNAKRIYIPVSPDDRPAWALFETPQGVRERMTASILAGDARPQESENLALRESIELLEQQFDRLYFDPCYQGAYIGRSAVCYAENPLDLYDRSGNSNNLEGDLASLYPPSLSDDLELLRNLEIEKQTLDNFQDRRIKTPGGIIEHRGKSIDRKDLAAAIEEVRQDLTTVRERIYYHDCLCRTTHRTIAARLGNDWEDYLVGLLKVLHYTDRTEANLYDVHGYMLNVLNVITADRNVSRRELYRLLQAANEVYEVLAQIYSQSNELQMDASLMQAFEGAAWLQILGDFQLTPPNEANINEWMKAIDSWISHTGCMLSALKTKALERLLQVENLVADAFRTSKTLEPAPKPSQIPARYPVLLPGGERKRQTRLGWWDRFQTADGLVPEILRLLVAIGVIVPALWFIATAGK